MTPKAIVLFSGGLDSTTTLAIAKSAGYALFAMSFNYGQQHKIEIDKAIIIAEDFGVKEHRIANIDLRQFGNSALTDSIDVPTHRDRRRDVFSHPGYLCACEKYYISILCFGIRRGEKVREYFYWRKHGRLQWLSRLSSRVYHCIRNTCQSGHQSQCGRVK